MMVGNWAQSILHGGVIASALDVAAGLVCVGSTLTRHDTINEDELRLVCREWAPLICASTIYARAGNRFTATSTLLRAGTRLRSRVSSYITKSRSISPAQPQPIWWVEPQNRVKFVTFCNGFS
jgi:acyl-coenzyme A thioesterase PaaI-like protein